MFEQLRAKFDEIARMDLPGDVINGPSEIMELAKAIGKSDLTEHEKERFFNSLKDECLAEFGHVKKADFNRILDEIEGERTGR